MPSPEVSIVIPTIREEKVFGIINTLRKMFGRGVEIIIVDKSDDAYYNRLRRTGVTVLRQTDKGVESAIMQGLRSAHGQILGSIDADGTHGIEGLEEAVEIVRSGKAGLVMGNRLAKLHEGSMTPYLKFGNAALSAIFTILYGRKVRDVLTGLFVMKRSTFNEMRDVKPYRAGIAMFAIELANRGYSIKEVDIDYYVREQGESKLAKSKLKYGMNVALLMAKRRFAS